MEKRFVGLGEGAGNVGMSAAVRFGDMIAVSGQVALDGTGNIVGRGDFGAQVEQCFANLATVLEQAGGALGDVVSLTTYLSSRDHASQFLAARGRAFPADPPATTTVIAQMLHPDFLIEIQALAAVAK
ncbi:MAG: RidA family protein [Novosphingobium sp.]|nr:RidA family protein [Novosphingobium sp.]